MMVNINRNMDKKNQKNRALDIMKKTVRELKLEATNILFLTILEHLLSYNDDSAEIRGLKQDVVIIFVNVLENISFEDFQTLRQGFKNILTPIELKNIIVKDANVKQFNEFARGGFGVIYHGLLIKPDGSNLYVALKQAINKESNNGLLLKEAKIMAQLDHKNVVKLLAFQKRPLRLIMEYMEWKSLDKAAHIHMFTGYDILKALHDVASGMEYISMKKFVHRDIACRNVFVDLNKNCKIGDFGFSLYFGDCSDGRISAEETPLIMYNTAPESRITQMYSVASDVWSFGILVWELYHTVKRPPLFVHAMELFQELKSTGLLPYISGCPLDLYFYVRNKILNGDPTKRPDFTAIMEKISELLASHNSILI